MSELLGLQPKPTQPPTPERAAKSMPSAPDMHPKLLKADYHGSIMTASIRVYDEGEQSQTRSVILHLSPTHTANTPFSLDPLPAAPAISAVLDAPHIEFELYGNQFRFRAAERSGRKFKHKETIEL
ncbi:hypothetical protein M422DRAFT_250426 [Sphaerobolus stellatus SS14]|uniref:Uncharacterized protein n=1 Tax=Sphaerobolus stellatus (strain SS14) TaxID=990650 RepID=A0A0C9W419_SPHS4|nr:hypothetical protein M422DRAFT_250426 [Sphaerobolus stellatus SS14]